ncbi:hypothetical protein [Cryptosporangium sp. NPDC048952]|uniref:hypothetical protein n=1 Tax=Cryptosporangium sp. NPDC048952 TaxID=3363961 RepID=UPI0037152D01
MPKKSIRRKRRQARRGRRRQQTPRAAESERTAADRAQFLAGVEAFARALIRERGTAADDDEDDWDEDEHDEDEDEEPPQDFEPEAHRTILAAIRRIVTTHTPQPAYDTVPHLTQRERDPRYNVCPGDGVLIAEMVAVSMLLDLRYNVRADPAPAIHWITERLGAEHGRRALRVADLLDHPDAPPWQSIHPPQPGEEPLLPAMVLLLAGIGGAATHRQPLPPN